MKTLIADNDLKATQTAFTLYMCYLVSFFIHIPSRIPVLGLLRIDLILVLFIFVLISGKKLHQQTTSPIPKLLFILLVYSILVIPFASWPGSVISKGIPEFIKAIIFFFFTYKLVLNEERLKKIIYLFILCNTFRVVEPLYLHITQGYWGSVTSFGWDQVGRLAGAPKDVINANGLAFVIASILPFYHYIFGSKGFLSKLVYWSVLPILLYTMSLTLSRSGILAVVIIYGVIFLKSKRKLIFAALAVVGVIGFLSILDDVQRDRYLSIVDGDTKSSSSAEGRVSGWSRDFEVAMVKPIFGHGLGTSAEANWNIAGETHRSHNLWTEVLQELGFCGLIIWALYVKAIYQGFRVTNEAVKTATDTSPFIKSCLPAMQVWLMMNFLFSFASYGLSSYEWYLFGAFSAVLQRIVHQPKEEVATQ
ncbi:MAG: hypothetical protein EOO07_07930 [Chitinophagaceae bacterium]|nr:MAG: hypothetical protein EOO07_07930 [Chitinophagaceae bacterium]